MRLMRVLAGLIFLAAGISAGFSQNVISDWLDTASTTIVINARKPPGATSAYLAYVTVAMYDAVESIDHRFRPFAVAVDPPDDAQQDAAAAVAAHDVLVHYFPDQRSMLDKQLAASLGAIPNGRPKQDGATVGAAVAAQWIAQRTGDGIEAPITYDPGHGPGIWEPVPNVPAPAPNVTPKPLEPWWTKFHPFVLRTPDQFVSFLDPPPALASAEWASDFNLTRRLGAQKSAERTAEQTEIGLFWTGADYPRALRFLMDAHHLNTEDSARMCAMAYVTSADAFGAAMSAKYHFGFWRPYTAIRNADVAVNAATSADASWIPLAPTPAHPEFPANHATNTQGFVDALSAFFGTDDVPITITSSATHTTRTFGNLQDVVKEVDMARIYGGMHYLHSVLQGNMLGRMVAAYVCAHKFQPAS